MYHTMTIRTKSPYHSLHLVNNQASRVLITTFVNVMYSYIDRGNGMHKNIHQTETAVFGEQFYKKKKKKYINTMFT